MHGLLDQNHMDIIDYKIFRKNIVGIGWPGIGKLSEIEFKSDIWKKLEKVVCTENRSNRAMVQDVGTIYRFTKEMKKDDCVLVPNGSEIYRKSFRR
ncbi:hypothetical protein [Fusobacterium necrogenes]|uniref:hypothetical protein n=1 Tax=Fusobacterium necrogenes TaxID=858 RepID=UPI00255C33C0|nr:hypothetical protein [Fusobacterium necrogenes]